MKYEPSLSKEEEDDLLLMLESEKQKQEEWMELDQDEEAIEEFCND